MNKDCIWKGNAPLEDNEEQIINSLRRVSISEIRSIDENCEQLFYEYVATSDIDSCAFSYNWPYVIQSTRGRGFYCEHNNAIVYFYLRKAHNPSQKYSLIIVNHLGIQSEKLACEIASAAKTLGIPTIVKNVDMKRIGLWAELGFIETLQPWSIYSFRDDNTFPEFVYDVEKFVKMDFSSRTRRLVKKFLRETHFTFVPYEEIYKKDGLTLLEKNSEYLESKGVDFKNEVILAHEFVFDEKIKNKALFAILEENRLIGLSYITQVNQNLFFNAIINENRSNLMRFLLWKTIVHYYESVGGGKKAQFLSLQGSENEGQNQWKGFFHPIRMIHRTHLTNWK